MAVLDAKRREYLTDRKAELDRALEEERGNVEQLKVILQDAQMQVDEAVGRVKNLEADVADVENRLKEK